MPGIPGSHGSGADRYTCNGCGAHGYNYYFANPANPANNSSLWGAWTNIQYSIVSATAERPAVLQEEFRDGDARVDSNGNVFVNITNIKIPEIEIGLLKINTSRNEDVVPGAQFTIVAEQNGQIIEDSSGTTGNDGMIRIGPFQPETIDPVTITITETVRADGYQILSENPIVITLTFNIRTLSWDADPTEIVMTEGERVTINVKSSGDPNILEVKIQNRSLIEELTIFKTDPQTGAPIEGIEFEVTFTNIRRIDGQTISGAQRVTTDSQGRIVWLELEIDDVDQDIVLEIRETRSVGSDPAWYKVLEGTIVVRLDRTGNVLSNISRAEDQNMIIIPQEFDPQNGVEIDGHEAEIIIGNIPIIRLGGTVWRDGQDEGKKTNQPANGLIDSNDLKIENVKVRLYTDSTSDKTQRTASGENIFEGNRVVRSLYGEDLANVRTDSNGKYEFKNLENAANYYVEFEYDGVNFDTTRKGSITNIRESHVSENDSKNSRANRGAFNDKFKTIQGGAWESAAIATGSSTSVPTLRYREEPYAAGGSDYYRSILITTVEDSDSPARASRNTLRMGDIRPEFQMFAQTTDTIIDKSKWKDTWTSDYMQNINMGLKERVLELSVGKDIELAKLTINDDKETIYTYNQIMMAGNSLQVSDVVGNDNSYDKKKYSLFLYASDYHFRIDHYIQGGDNSRQGGIDNKATKETDIELLKNTNELEVYILYKLVLNNQTTHNGVRIEEVKDYFDSNYRYVEGSAKYLDSNRGSLGTPNVNLGGTKTIGGVTYKEMTITGLGQNLGDGGQQIIEMMFQVIKDDNRSISIQPDKQEYKNFANISKYSTDEGFIDRLSAPGIVVGSRGEIHHTNHSDEAPGLEIKLNSNNREMTGIVWEDEKRGLAGMMDPDGYGYKHGDGVYASGETPVNDVIVQLIELRTIQGIQFEYIWQETRTGSNEVKSLEIVGGRDVNKYTNGVTAAGTYKFEHYIPGDYIVRFIYGDGETYDLTPTSEANVRKYNGQDYQSTIDKKYNEKKFDYRYNDTAGKNNDARDNEARRLEVMAETARINNYRGKELDSRSLQSLEWTWMCSETSILDVSFEQRDNYTAPYGDTVISGVQPATYYVHRVKDLDFGLQERPKTTLELEKHLVGLKIDVIGVGPILDVRADNIDEVKAGNFNSSHGKEDLMILGTSTRANRGEWYFQTDVDELARGANLEAIYQYTVHNTSEVDYLAIDVVNAYKSNSIADYISYLKAEAQEVKGNIQLGTHVNGTHLGKAYYLGISRDGVERVPSRAEQIEEGLNNALSFDVTTWENVGVSFKKANDQPIAKRAHNQDGDYSDSTMINTIVQTKDSTENLFPLKEDGSNKDESLDNSKEIILTRGLNNTSFEDELLYHSYIAGITEYSNAAGRRDIGVARIYEENRESGAGAVPGNLGYAHSDDSRQTLAFMKNEHDEFWGESIRITKPTGEDEQARAENNLNMAIAVAIPSLVVLAAGIVLIMKFVVFKK